MTSPCCQREWLRGQSRNSLLPPIEEMRSSSQRGSSGTSSSSHAARAAGGTTPRFRSCRLPSICCQMPEALRHVARATASHRHAAGASGGTTPHHQSCQSYHFPSPCYQSNLSELLETLPASIASTMHDPIVRYCSRQRHYFLLQVAPLHLQVAADQQEGNYHRSEIVYQQNHMGWDLLRHVSQEANFCWCVASPALVSRQRRGFLCLVVKPSLFTQYSELINGNRLVNICSNRYIAPAM